VVRINDQPNNYFGTFSNDHPFDVLISWDSSVAAPIANVVLRGEGTSGTADIPLSPIPFAQNFSIVTFWIGSPWLGSFSAVDMTSAQDPVGAAEALI